MQEIFGNILQNKRFIEDDTMNLDEMKKTIDGQYLKKSTKEAADMDKFCKVPQVGAGGPVQESWLN